MTRERAGGSAGPRILYLSLHATAPGQAGWADVDEIIDRLRARGWIVDLRQPSYVGRVPPGGVARLVETMTMQVPVIPTVRKYDAVYVRSHVLAFPTALAARLTRVPIIQECNGGADDLFIAWPQVRPLKRPLLRMGRAQFRWADEIITVTPQLGRWLESESGRRRVTVIPNGANVDLFHPDAESSKELPPSYVVFFGSLAPWQGIVTMLSATEDPAWPADARLVIAGDGALRADVERAAEAGRVVFLGNCPQAELPGIVAGSIGSLIVKDHPAHAASGLSPLKLYESMAAGVPVVVSALPGLVDTVERFDCGVVVPPGDAGAVARAVAELKSAPETRRRLGENGRRAAVAEYSWDIATDATARVIERAIGRRR
jgi:glycosyltransferase involved in cell wall biosynthesis